MSPSEPRSCGVRLQDRISPSESRPCGSDYRTVLVHQSLDLVGVRPRLQDRISPSESRPCGSETETTTHHQTLVVWWYFPWLAGLRIMTIIMIRILSSRVSYIVTSRSNNVYDVWWLASDYIRSAVCHMLSVSKGSQRVVKILGFARTQCIRRIVNIWEHSQQFCAKWYFQTVHAIIEKAFKYSQRVIIQTMDCFTLNMYISYIQHLNISIQIE
jgi:hypothetical protein